MEKPFTPEQTALYDLYNVESTKSLFMVLDNASLPEDHLDIIQLILQERNELPDGVNTETPTVNDSGLPLIVRIWIMLCFGVNLVILVMVASVGFYLTMMEMIGYYLDLPLSFLFLYLLYRRQKLGMYGFIGLQVVEGVLALSIGLWYITLKNITSIVIICAIFQIKKNGKTAWSILQ